MTDDSTTSPTAAVPQPLLWVPGVVRMQLASASAGPGVVMTGPCVGWVPEHMEEPARWSADFVKRSAITDALRTELGLVLPDDRVDASSLPQVHRAAMASTLVRVTPGQRAQFVARNIPVYFVVHGAARDEWYVSLQGGETKTEITGGSLDPYAQTGLPAVRDTALESLARAIHRDVLADRLLRALSNDALTLESVRLARVLPCLASDGEDPEPIPDLFGWDTWLAEILDRATPFATVAADLVLALEALPLDADRDSIGQVPFFPAVRALRVPTVSFRLTPPLHVVDHPDGAVEDSSTITLPARTLWTVDMVEPWTPATDVRPAPEPEAPRPQQVPRSVVVAVLGIALMLLLAVWLARRIPRASAHPNTSTPCAVETKHPCSH